MDNTYTRLRALFEQCVEMPEGECELWIDRHVVDTDLRLELELLLAADRGESGFLQQDVVAHIDQLGAAGAEDFSPDSLIGRRFGAFRLQRLLGQGGQGTVYLADRADGDFAQTAAVKLLRRGIHDSAEHRRFRREREILARFEHAGVARLIDGGVSGDGVPYLIMEYVEGVSIEQWNVERGAELHNCVALFAQLCEIVAAAHRALIVHRDLKPSNVLVTPDGVVKVLDFGIARLLDEDDVQTRTVIPLMTPGYGAPEQARGGAITLATDVHALGMLLRVLLTGSPPPMTPGEAKVLPGHLPAELRWIIAKACALEPERRYRDATELGDDLARFLGARPVLAHPPSRWYTTRKFINRHRGGVLTTAAVLIAILASAAVAGWQARVAREQALRAEATRDFLLSVFEAAEEDLPKDARPTPDVLARAAAKKLQGDTRLAPAMHAQFLSMLGAISYRTSDAVAAAEYQAQALHLLDLAGDTNSRERLRIEVRLAWALSNAGKAAEAETLLAPRLAALRSVTDELSVDGLSAYSDAREATGHVPESLALIREATDLAQKVYPPDSEKSLNALLFLGHALSNTDIRQATELTESTLARWRTLNLPKRQSYTTALSDLAEFKRRQGDVGGAVRLLRETLRLWRDIHEGANEDTALTLSSLGRTLGERGEYEEAEALLKESSAMIATLYDPHHRYAINALGAEGALAINRQHYAEAVDLLQSSATRCDEAKMDSQPRCITNRQQLSLALLRLGRIDEADVAMARSLELRRKLVGEKTAEYAYALRGSGEVQHAQKQFAAAMTTFDAALAIHTQLGTLSGVDAAALYASRARTLVALQRPQDALIELERADPIVRKMGPQPAGRQIRILATRAAAYAALGRADEARAAARDASALEAARAALEPGDWELVQQLLR
ncbi:MAG: serine/threonine-protein kinase [Tahibacter sp.]